MENEYRIRLYCVLWENVKYESLILDCSKCYFNNDVVFLKQGSVPCNTKHQTHYQTQIFDCITGIYISNGQCILSIKMNLKYWKYDAMPFVYKHLQK